MEFVASLPEFAGQGFAYRSEGIIEGLAGPPSGIFAVLVEFGDQLFEEIIYTDASLTGDLPNRFGCRIVDGPSSRRIVP